MTQDVAGWLSNLHEYSKTMPTFVQPDDYLGEWSSDGALERAQETNERNTLNPEAIGGAVLAELRNMRAKRLARERDRADQREQLERGTLDESATSFLERLTEDAKEGAQLDDVPDPEPLIDGLLYRNTVNYLAGASGAYKSVTALDIAARVGKGESFCTMPVARGRALYVVAEGLSGMKFRRRAWEIAHNSGEEMQGVTFIPYAVQIGNLTEMSALIKYAKDGEYDLIIFDTQAMCTLGFDENNNAEMSIIVDALLVMARVTNGCVLVVHHTGKNEENGMRGASSQYANVNTVIVAKREGSSQSIVLSTARAKGGKQKDADEIHTMRFTTTKDGLPSVVLAQGVIEGQDTITGASGGVHLSGRYDVRIMNLLVGHENLGATASEITRWVADSGVTTGNGNPVDAKTIRQALDKLVGSKVIDRVAGSTARFKVSDLGFDVLREMAGD